MTGDPHHPSAGQAPDAGERRRLKARAHQIKACLSVGRRGITEPVLEEIRQAFDHADLIKVRVRADNAEETNEAAAELAARVPCHLVQRVGRVALLYRPKMEPCS